MTVKKTLTKQNSLWNESLNSLSSMLLIVEKEGRIVNCNEAFRKYNRKPKNEILGNYLWRVILKLKQKPKACIIDGIKLSKKRKTIEVNVGNRTLKISLDPIFGRNKQVKNMIVLLTDITEKKKVLKELEIRENKYKDLVELANVAIASDDKNGNLVYFNKQFADLFGYTVDEMKSKSHQYLVHKDDIEMIKQMHKSRFKGEAIMPRYEFRGIKKDGSTVYIDISVNEIIKDNGEIIGSRSYLRDITERKMFIQELELALLKAQESDRLKSAFLTNLSHEIRTPLNGIMGFSKLLDRDNLNARERKAYIEIIDKSSNQLLTIISDILDISTIETGQLKLNRYKFNINEIIESVIEIYSPLFREKKLNFFVSNHLSNNNLVVYADKSRLKQLITNLLSNALKFTKEGKVNFKCLFSDDELEIRIEDTGIGIDKEYHEKIFDSFWQVEQNQTRFYEGNGLGLSIAKGIAEEMGGKIIVESELGKGSVFKMLISLSKIL